MRNEAVLRRCAARFFRSRFLRDADNFFPNDTLREACVCVVVGVAWRAIARRIGAR